MSVSIVCLFIALVGLVVPRVLPSPFTYTNVPFPVCDPAPVYGDSSDCARVSPNYAFHREQVVPMLIGRCYSDLLGLGEQTVGYTISRAIVSDHNGIRILLAETFTDIRRGCSLTRTLLHAVPSETPSGVFHFEGVAHVLGRDYLWRSESFQVDKPEA